MNLIEQLSHIITGISKADSAVEDIIINLIHLTSNIRKDNIKEKLNSEFCLEIAEPLLLDVLEAMEEKGSILVIDEQIVLSEDTIKSLNQSIQRNEEVQKKSLIDWKNTYEKTYNVTLNEKEIGLFFNITIHFFRKLFISHGVASYNLIYGGAANNVAAVGELANALTLECGNSNLMNLKPFLHNILNGEYTSNQKEMLLRFIGIALSYVCSVSSQEKIEITQKLIASTELYLDTNTLFRLLKLQGEKRYDWTKSAFDLFIQNGFKIKVYRQTYEELERVLKKAAKALRESTGISVSHAQVALKNQSTDDYFSAYWAEKLKSNISVEEFNIWYSRPDALLNNLGISINDTDYSQDEKINNDIHYIYGAVSNADKQKRKSDITIYHDAYCLAVTAFKRGDSYYDIINGECLFLTADKGLIQVQRQNTLLSNYPPIALRPTELVQLLPTIKPTKEYAEVFLGLFSSTNIFIKGRNFNNEQITEILSRIERYSTNLSSQIAERVLLGDSMKNYTDDNPGVAIGNIPDEEIEKIITAEMEKLESKFEQQQGVLEETQKEADKNKKKAEENIELIDNQAKRLMEHDDRRHKVLVKKKNKALVCSENYSSRKMLFGYSLMGVGVLLVVFFLFSIIPWTSGYIEKWLQKYINSTAMLKEFTVGNLLVTAVGWIGGFLGYFKIVKNGKKYYTEHNFKIQVGRIDEEEFLTDVERDLMYADTNLSKIRTVSDSE